MAKKAETTKKDILDHLARDSRVDASKIKIKIKKDEAILSGKVHSYSAKKAAEADAWVIPGIKNVENNLEIEYVKAMKVPPKGEVLQNVMDVLKWSPDIDESKLEVTIDSGVITLEGTVKTYWEKNIAEEMVFNVTGVLSVRNELGVVPTEKIDDEEVAKEILDSYEKSKKLNVDDVDVEVRNGFVKLSGEVVDWNARRAAEDIAGYTTGAIGVENNLEIAS